MTAVIDKVAVVIPAHDEESLLPACLDAVRLAIECVDVPVEVVVALDDCRDASASVVAVRPWAATVELSARNVGAARAAATAYALGVTARSVAERIWIATTDADTVVPAHWLASQLALADAGYDLVIGTVDVDDWSAHPPHTGPRWRATYTPADHHPHVHGANLGVRASAYLEVGGWPTVAVDEDVSLVAALTGRRIARSAAHPVITSARTDARARGGFGDTLVALAG
ncbi:MAG TPA: glycosyltransferase [Mycobacteriales bacterium]|nr:glycosyltransferase [Mycobacteriales bacterium]HWB67208.1 glycosyltransferase [Mycobacteriales bacterium]